MSEVPISRSRQEIMRTYIQADGVARVSQFAGYVAELKKLVAGCHYAEATDWAKRAVSPTMDYSSLIKLSRFLRTQTLERAEGITRLAILGGPTTSQLRQLIELIAAAEGINVYIYEAGYGLFRHEILTPGSGLDTFGPHVVFLACDARSIARHPSHGLTEDEVAKIAIQEIEEWSRLWETIHTKWNATVLQNNFVTASENVYGHYSLRFPSAREHYIERLNKLMAETAPAYTVLHDLRSLATEVGASTWFDHRFYHEFKMPCGPESLVKYAYSVVSLLRAIVGKSKKVLVLDLDNTLWGGVVGDVGAGGIRVGQGSGEGEAYLAFQSYVLGLQRRGIVLAVCSKNDEDKAREPFEKREDMILRMTDLSCFVANWENKADNLRTIAGRLNLGLDSIVFVDDNPAERALVRQALPQVAVPDLPADPAGYIQALSLHRYFETTGLTSEDTARARYYTANAKRSELAACATDLPTFLASLDMRVRVAPLTDVTIERAAQLVNKSNQFNLTTRRYTVAQLKEMGACPDWRTLTLSLRDNVDDNGLIAVVLLRKVDQTLTVDTWVMSCRVLQRGVEEFTRNELVALARAEECDLIVGTFIPTAKNTMVSDLYLRLGFTPVGADGSMTFWSFTVDSAIKPMANFIRKVKDHE